MKITIAGYGAIGQYQETVFRCRHEIQVYDPAKGYDDLTTLSDADFVFVCVPTPSLPDGACDTSAVEDVVSLAQPRIAIVCFSTVAIGTTERLIEAYHKPIVFVPEYAGEAPDHPFRDLQAREFFIYGGYEPAASQVRDLFVDAYPMANEHRIVDPTTAETAKYMENAFLALKVAFSNEIYDLCSRTGVDYNLARELWTLDWRVGESHTRVTPQRGYAGKCLPKDVAALTQTARELGSPLEIMEAVQHSNDRVRAAEALVAAPRD